jgi:hypothetical protein
MADVEKFCETLRGRDEAFAYGISSGAGRAPPERT